ncbi:MAG: PAS domain S-box protein, partial [Methanomicrobiales archaeon]|nr:PAS domain S-box protein [Methanomicrobiales archaeon]
MSPEREIHERVLRALRARPKGMTITDIARALGMNRNSVSKHLEVMQVAGQVESRPVGNAKVYSAAHRVPLSAFLCFTKNPILVLDAGLAIIQANDQFLRQFQRTKEDLIGQNLPDAGLPALSTPDAITIIENIEREQTITGVCCQRESFYQIHAIPTTFEDGEKGCTIVLEDITERRRYIQNTTFLARTAMELVDLPPVDDIYQYIADHLIELAPGARTYLLAHDEVDRQFSVRAVAGEGFREGLTELLGRDPVGLPLPVARAFEIPYLQTPHVMRGMREFVLRPEPSSWTFFDICFGAIPEEICEEILSRFTIGTLWTAGLVWQDQIFGIAGIFLEPGKALDNRETVESFIRLASIALARRQTEGWLRQNEERFRGMVDSSPFAVALINPGGRFAYVNRKFVEVFGYGPEDALTCSEWFRLVFPDADYRRESVRAWQSDLERSVAGQARPREFTVRCRDGSKKVILFRPVTLPDKTQYITCEDITEEIRTYHLLLADIADLRRREEELLLKDRAIASTRRAVALLDPGGVVTYVTAPPIEIGGIQGFSAQRLQPQSHNIYRRILVAIHHQSTMRA